MMYIHAKGALAAGLVGRPFRYVGLDIVFRCP